MDQYTVAFIRYTAIKLEYRREHYDDEHRWETMPINVATKITLRIA